MNLVDEGFYQCALCGHSRLQHSDAGCQEECDYGCEEFQWHEGDSREALRNIGRKV